MDQRYGWILHLRPISYYLNKSTAFNLNKELDSLILTPWSERLYQSSHTYHCCNCSMAAYSSSLLINKAFNYIYIGIKTALIMPFMKNGNGTPMSYCCWLKERHLILLIHCIVQYNCYQPGHTIEINKFLKTCYKHHSGWNGLRKFDRIFGQIICTESTPPNASEW